MSVLDPADPEVTADEIRAEAVAQLKSARELAKKVRAEAVAKLEDARARVRQIATREEEMAERWAKLLEAENQMAVSPPPSTSAVSQTDPDALVRAAQEEALRIIAQAQTEARDIREQAMRLLAVAEGEKAESLQKAHSETERAMVEAQILRTEAEQEAERLRRDAEHIREDDESVYSKRGRKLPRIGDSANNLLAEMSSLRSKLGEDEDLKVV
jgi:vacuolar-type H+-ATPase subunit H